MNEALADAPGVFGKLPNQGDFIQRHLPGSFIEPWDRWLQESIACSREQLGERWLDIYLTSPMWRFLLSPSIAGQAPWAGVLMPSVDRVGRYFPLTLACALPQHLNPLEAMTGNDAWFARSEALLLSCLEEHFELQAFEHHLIDLGPLFAPSASSNVRVTGQGNRGSANAWRFETGGVTDLRAACPDLLRQTLTELLFAYSLWWTEGSEHVAPSLLVCQGLPPTEGFSGLLAGDWRRWGWHDRSLVLAPWPGNPVTKPSEP